ncbi:hypothetical protein [Rickettsia canadensis]|nr:hypothetical protein [Rickettsia canadensis]
MKLNSDGKITIDSEDFYSSITTKTKDQGTAIFLMPITALPMM